MVTVLMACGADEQYIWVFKARVNWQIQALGTGTNTDCMRTIGTITQHQYAAVATHEAVLE